VGGLAVAGVEADESALGVDDEGGGERGRDAAGEAGTSRFLNMAVLSPLAGLPIGSKTVGKVYSVRLVTTHLS